MGISTFYTFSTSKKTRRRCFDVEIGRAWRRGVDDTGFKFVRAKIDEKACGLMRDGQVVQQLRDMFARKRFHGLQFDQQTSVDDEIGKIRTQHDAIVIINRQWFLRLDTETGPFQAMAKAVLVDLFEQAVAEIDVQLVSHLPNFLNQTLDLVFHSPRSPDLHVNSPSQSILHVLPISTAITLSRPFSTFSRSPRQFPFPVHSPRSPDLHGHYSFPLLHALPISTSIFPSLSSFARHTP